MARMATTTQLIGTPRPGIRLSYPSIDDCLGPAGQRFFGSGYRRVTYTMRGGVLRCSSGGVHLTAAAKVDHPHDWSVKGGVRPRRPHLTTLDAIVLATRGAELCAERAHGLDRAQRRRTRLRRIDVKAASAPVEVGLDDVVVDVRLVASAPPVSGRRQPGAVVPVGSLLSTVDGRVAGMRVRLVLEHDAGDRGGSYRAGWLPVPDGVLADRRPGTYGRGYTGQWQSIRHVTLDLADVTAQAQVCLGAGAEPPALPASAGRSASSRPATALDSFVVCLQLGQALLYETDEIPRAESDTLWMRHTTIVDSAPTGIPQSVLTTARLCDPVLVRSRDELWRTATIDGDVAGVRTRCAVAHRLPTHRAAIGAR
jgi:hypothetical protein